MRESDVKKMCKFCVGIGACVTFVGLALTFYVFLVEGYRNNDDLFIPMLAITMGLLIVFIFAIRMNMENMKENKNRQLIVGKNMVIGTIKDFARDLTHEANYVVICSYIDEFTGTEYVFKSESMLQNPELHLTIGDTVNIYVNPNDYQENFVDIYEAINRAEMKRIQKETPIEIEESTDFSNEFFS